MCVRVWEGGGGGRSDDERRSLGKGGSCLDAVLFSYRHDAAGPDSTRQSSPHDIILAPGPHPRLSRTALETRDDSVYPRGIFSASLLGRNSSSETISQPAARQVLTEIDIN